MDFLVDLTKDLDHVIGSRMMGGGFGGCTINIIHKHSVKNFIDSISKDYEKIFKIKLTSIIVSTSDGVSIES